MNNLKEFERDDLYMERIFLDALNEDVHLNASIEIRYGIGTERYKLKAWCSSTNTNLQFPRKLRQYAGQKYVADVIQSANKRGKPFYRAYKHSIRDVETGEIVG